MFGIVRVPPDVLVVVAAGCALERHERPAAVGGLVADDVGDDEGVRILRVHVRHGFVDAAGRPRVGGAAGPGFACIVRSIDPGAVAVASTVAKTRRGLLGAMPSSASIRPRGSPWVRGFHVVPPSVDLKMPPLVPFQAPFSHGPCRCSHIVA